MAALGVAGGRKPYFKENTMILVTEQLTGETAVDILKAVLKIVGRGNLLALRPRQAREYELTMADKKSTEALMDGVEIDGVHCEVKPLGNNDIVVSFLHLLAYLPDEDIRDKLQGWGVVPLQQIRRRYYLGTDITDGTRYVKARFPSGGLSLPYSTSFMTAEGPRYFRVIHDRQVKTCRLCKDPEHLVRDCPELKCRECCEQGHYARDCKAAKCPQCTRALISCVCPDEDVGEDPVEDVGPDAESPVGHTEEVQEVKVDAEETPAEGQTARGRPADGAEGMDSVGENAAESVSEVVDATETEMETQLDGGLVAGPAAPQVEGQEREERRAEPVDPLRKRRRKIPEPSYKYAIEKQLERRRASKVGLSMRECGDALGDAMD